MLEVYSVIALKIVMWLLGTQFQHVAITQRNVNIRKLVLSIAFVVKF